MFKVQRTFLWAKIQNFHRFIGRGNKHRDDRRKLENNRYCTFFCFYLIYAILWIVESCTGSDLTYYANQSIVGRTINNQVVQNSKHSFWSAHFQTSSSFHWHLQNVNDDRRKLKKEGIYTYSLFLPILHKVQYCPSKKFLSQSRIRHQDLISVYICISPTSWTSSALIQIEFASIF